jgi:nucleoid DNA-binding protein
MNYNPLQIKQAYQLVQEDLFNQLQNAQSGETIRLGNLGKFTKTETKLSNPQYGAHVYYKLTFRCFSKLKNAFHNQLSKKYSSKRR